MLMNEVREKTGLTRKAIEYYEEKGFITPERESNNYRI
ncbi:MerR family DNA-binding transcriptional regulator [Facklamia sp. 7083-14-GEN3]|nr:MerR family DNA-binding transcriptional regulator [Facklamia sp. 7083-14-GEN3]MCR8968750.1 MerR family DNA-binding transcriptional regulator [Facklamia sp. 7083-14-GEN3]